MDLGLVVNRRVIGFQPENGQTTRKYHSRQATPLLLITGTGYWLILNSRDEGIAGVRAAYTDYEYQSP